MLVKYLRALLNQFAKKSDLGLYAKRAVLDYGAPQKITSVSNFVVSGDGVLIVKHESRGGQASVLYVDDVSDVEVCGTYISSGASMTVVHVIPVQKGHHVTCEATLPIIHFVPYK